MESLPHHLRNTVTGLDLPIFVELDGDECRTPPNLALGDTLMVLGIIRNQGRPVRLFCDTKYREVLEGHPLVAEIVDRPEPLKKLKVLQVRAQSSGRDTSWVSALTHFHPLPPVPLDMVRANHVYSHSLYYNLPRKSDRPGIHLDRERNSPLSGLLSRKKPTLVMYCHNPGRKGGLWYDETWWLALAGRLAPDFCLVAVGGKEYGGLASACDETLPMDDPNSTLADLAWLMNRASGFVGKDGGLCHLAQAAGANAVVVWDSMLSYRFWSCSSARNLVFSNPYSFRYPQTLRLDPARLAEYLDSMEQAELLQVAASLGLGSPAEIMPPGRGAISPSRAAAIGMAIQQNEERESLRAWTRNPELKKRVYAQSLEFALKAVSGASGQPQNWILPLFP